jgi:hypothetical protein
MQGDNPPDGGSLVPETSRDEALAPSIAKHQKLE